jgi:predicted Fe-Mo cluster-binding NifX family protein
VLVALPNCQGRVSPVFDVAARLILVDFKDGDQLSRREVVLFEKTPEGILQDLRELGIEVLICGAISAGLKEMLQQTGIRVLAEICGEIEPVLAAYKAGRLSTREFLMPGCCARRWETERKGGRCQSRRALRGPLKGPRRTT